jgi:hypothetical protein
MGHEVAIFFRRIGAPMGKSHAVGLSERNTDVDQEAVPVKP